MAFTGDLDTFDLFDLLSWLLGRRKSGTLVLTRRSTRKRFAFREATLMSSSSNDPRETIGQALVRERFISEEALFTALVRQESDRRRLGAILIGEGLLSEEQLLRTLRANAEAQIADAFLWPEGRFDFRDDEVPPPEAGELGIELRPVLDEGRHRREQWQLLRERFPSSEVTFRVTGALERVVDPTQKQILAVALAGKTLAAISLEARRSEYDTALLLAQLCDEGLLTVDRIEAGSAEADPVGTIIALLAAAEMRLKEGRFEAALEAYERVLAIDGVNQAAKKGLVALTEARRKAKAARKVPLDKVPVLRLTAMSLTQQKFDPQEGFVLSRINGQWDVRSILKLCPIPEDDALLIFARLLDRQVIELR